MKIKFKMNRFNVSSIASYAKEIGIPRELCKEEKKYSKIYITFKNWVFRVMLI